MQLTINIKQLGKKRPLVAEHILTIDDLPPNPTLDDLITHVVRQQVQAYNAKRQQRGGNQQKSQQQETLQEENPLLNTLIISEQRNSGKIGFGEIYNDKLADEQTAIETARLAFTDGLYCVFIDEEQIEQLDTPIVINTTDVNTTDVNTTDVNTTDVNTTDVNTTDVNNTDVNNTDVNNTDVNKPHVVSFVRLTFLAGGFW